MCLITFAYKSHPEYSLILIANRDEFYQRPSLPMHFWDDHNEILAGRDLEQLGTWLGFNTAGKFTAVTNYRDGRNPAKNRRSRGELTANFLKCQQSADEYLLQLEQNKQEFGDFNLLVADQTGLYYCSNRGAETHELQPGIYGMSNALLDTPWPKLQRVKQDLTNAINSSALTAEHLMGIMGNRETAPDKDLPDTGISLNWERLLSSSFIQADNYGTRATTLVMQKPNGDTTVIEQGFDVGGPLARSEYKLTLPAIGVS